MLEETIETMCDQINENFQLAAEVDKYVLGLGGDALAFAKAVWDISMILAAVVFAIVACFELYTIAVRTEARGGPMGSAEVVFKLLFKVAVCLIMLQVSFDVLVNLYLTTNSLTEAIGSITYGTKLAKDVIDTDVVVDALPGGFDNVLPFLCALVVLLLSWAAKIAAVLLIMLRLVQVYLYLAVSPIPLATFPSQELSQIGKSFLKQFVAVGLQGTLIYLVVRFLPAMIATALETNLFVSGDSITGALAVGALYSLAILITLMGTQQLSRRICGAM